MSILRLTDQKEAVIRAQSVLISLDYHRDLEMAHVTTLKEKFSMTLLNFQSYFFASFSSYLKSEKKTFRNSNLSLIQKICGPLKIELERVNCNVIFHKIYWEFRLFWRFSRFKVWTRKSILGYLFNLIWSNISIWDRLADF